MDKLQLRYTADEAERIAAWLDTAAASHETTRELEDIAEQAARLRHLAARARKRAAQDPAA